MLPSVFAVALPPLVLGFVVVVVVVVVVVDDFFLKKKTFVVSEVKK